MPDPPKPKKPRKPASGPQAEVMRHWDSEWERTRLGTSFTWSPKDAALMAKALKMAANAPGIVQDRITTLLESSDAWMAQNASPGLLVSKWNQLAVTVLPPRIMSNADKAIAEYERMGGTFVDSPGLFESETPKLRNGR